LSEEYKAWSLEKLLRKADQEWDMAGLARTDGDLKDAAEHTRRARLYVDEARERKVNE
jgi:hypothetical protein